ncbi:MAG TPA: 50S ribosomal protein L21 [Spirochaetota bacterium]
MYAIVEITGKQYKVEKDAVVNVDTFEAAVDSSIKLDNVLMFVDGEKVLVGKPYLSNVKVNAKVLGEFQGKKVRGMKFKRRKNYQRFKSDRAHLLSLKVEGISLA